MKRHFQSAKETIFFAAENTDIKGSLNALEIKVWIEYLRQNVSRKMDDSHIMASLSSVLF